MRLYLAQIEITTRCNATCLYCSHSKLNKEKSEINISVDNFKTVLKKLEPFTNCVHLQGVGEPFLHPEFEKLLYECKKAGLVISTTTNGSIMNEKALFLIDILYISLDSVTSWKGNQRRGLNPKKTVSTLIRAGELAHATDIYISTVVSDNNIRKIKGILNFANEHKDKIAGVVLSPMLDFSIDKISLSEYAKNELQSFVFMYSDIRVSAGFLKGHVNIACGWLENKTYFDVYGNLRPCCIRSDSDDIKFGNIYQHDLTKILRNKKVQSFLQLKSRGILDTRCRRCVMSGSHLLWS